MILTHAGELSQPVSTIVSLVPSQTELLHSLGLERETIAITKFCVHPKEWFESKTRIGGTKALDLEKIMLLRPELVIANKEENIKEQVESLAEELNVWVTDVNDINDAYTMISNIGILTGKAAEADHLTRKILSQFQLHLPVVALLSRPRVAYLIWRNPYMTIGADTFINSMLNEAGFKNVFENKIRYPETSIEELAALDCDCIFLSSEPYPFAQKHINELKMQLPAVEILLVDGEMFSWYGSRLLHAPAYFKKLKGQLSILQ